MKPSLTPKFAPLAAASALAVAFAASPVLAQNVQVVRIAHVAPMSGGIAHVGRDTENGVRMAIDELNAQNPAIGGKKVRFEIVPEDDAGDPKQAAAIAQKLCDMKVNGVVGHLQSGTSIPAAKIYHDCGIPHITFGATNPELTKPGYDTTYRDIANDNDVAGAVAVHAANTLKIKRAAIIDDRTAFGQGLATAFEDTAKKNGIEIVDHEFTTDKATDFMSILTAIKAKKPDAIFYGGLDSQAGPMLRQIDQLGMTGVKFLGGDAICTESIATLSTKSASVANVYCATGGRSIEKLDGGIEWKKRYDTKFPGAFQIYGAYSYDATMVLADAMKRAGSANPKTYIPALQKANYKGVTGQIQFTDKGELTHPTVTLYTYKNFQRTAID